MYRKIDLAETWAIADSLAQTGATVLALTNRIRPLLPHSAYLSSVGRSVAWWESSAHALRRRIVRVGQSPPTPVTPTWSQGPPLAEHLESPPSAAAFFASLSQRQATALAARYPDLIGPIDGAPFSLRYLANHLLAVRYLEGLRRRRKQTERTGGPEGVAAEWWDRFRWSFALLDGRRGPLDDDLAEIDRRIADAERWADEDRHFLRFDPSGDGLIVEVLGQIETSQHVAVVVPGVGNELVDYESGLRANAGFLHDELGGSDTSIVVWLGYDAPDNLLAATNPSPLEAAETLKRFLDGLEVANGRTAHVSLIGHSYGSLVAGTALLAGARADEVVFIGSPGVGVDHASELRLPAASRVWTSRGSSDPIRFAREVQCLDLTPICFPSKGRLFFGNDPTDPSFGATEFEAGDASIRDAHSSYFLADSPSLRNLAFIVRGQDDRVTRPTSRIAAVSG
jgi:hypothetical protein